MPNQLSQVKTLSSSSGKSVETKCLKGAELISRDVYLHIENVT